MEVESAQSSEHGPEPGEERPWEDTEGKPLADLEARIDRALETLSEEVRELSLGTTGEVERIEGPLSPLDFLRNYVLPGRPCIITGALDHWPALQKWSNDYLRSALQNQSVSVHFTPDGRADAVVDPLHLLSTCNCPIVAPPSIQTPTPPSSARPSESPSTAPENETSNGSLYTTENETSNRNVECDDVQGGVAIGDSPDFLFVRAHVQKLKFSEALNLILENSAGGREAGEGVAYAQEQNGCFLSEYGALTGDAEVHIPWATEALGCMPEAVNLWIGNEHAVTSFHKDHYENLYAVVAGAKHFTLLPPVDVHRMYIKDYPSAQYIRMKNSKQFGIVLDQPCSMVPWVSVDPFPVDGQASESMFPKYFKGSQPFSCTVQAGEILYLPSMWFHHVRQSPDLEDRTIALNFWYDMQFDIKYAYFNMMQSLL